MKHIAMLVSCQDTDSQQVKEIMHVVAAGLERMYGASTWVSETFVAEQNLHAFKQEVSAQPRRDLAKTFTELINRWRGPWTSEVNRPWWVDLLKWTPKREGRPGDQTMMRDVLTLLDELATTTGTVPTFQCRRLGIPRGSRYGEAATKLRAILEAEIRGIEERSRHGGD